MFSEITIGVTTVAFSKNKILVEQLKQMGFKRVKVNEEGKRLDKSELLTFLSDCQVAIVGLDKIDGSILKELPLLKVISKYGVGLDNIDIEACSMVKITLLHTQGVNRRSVSEMALGFMIALLRNLYLTSNQLKEGVWNKNGGVQLSQKTVGIIGVGNIGKDLISLLKPFNCRILVNDIIDQGKYYRKNGLFETSKDVLLKESDVVSIHTPLTPQTKHLFNSKTFELMKPSSILINTARGDLINLADLKEAIKSGKIAGAAIDVYDKEPPEDQELLNMQNLINTPHIGGNAKEAVEAMGQAAIDNLLHFYKGK